jgi:F-type H+-transporting ATPase subunit gamma
LNGLVTRVDQDAHPLLHIPEAGQGRPLLIVISADRGLCGSFNSNIIKAASQFILTEGDEGRNIALGLIGRKGRDFFRRRGFDVRYEQVNVFSRLKFSDAVEVADAAIEQFTSGEASSVYLVYNEFKSVISQRVVVERLLPIPRLEVKEEASEGPTVDYVYEPTPQEIFRDLIPRHVQIQVYRALLESAAAEHAARMTAMDAATRNSAEMIENLTLYMNKVRQAAITREIIEVVSGAAAT